MLAIPVDRDSSAIPGTWEADGARLLFEWEILRFFLPSAFGLFFERDVKNAVMVGCG